VNPRTRLMKITRPRALVMIRILSAMVLGLAVLPTRSAAGSTSLAGSKPNIIFIFSDDHAAQAMGAYGSRFGADVTPRLDRMAKDGATFENTICGNPICGPSRATLLTGKFSHANRFFSNEYSPGFDGSQSTLPKLMREAGYATALIGKWHLASTPVGFDHFEILPGHGSYYNPVLVTDKGPQKYPGGYVTNVITERALNWLKKDRDPQKPFVLMVHHKSPHRNWVPGPEEMNLFRGRIWPEPNNLRDNYADRSPVLADARMRISDHLYFDNDLLVATGKPEFMGGSLGELLKGMPEPAREKFLEVYAKENANFLQNPPAGDALLRWKYQRYLTDYLRCVAGVDRSVGQILDELKAANLAENTLVIYSSDQGFFLGEHGWYDKRFAYEESARMPFLLSWPGKVAAGTRIPALTQNTDFLPTFLDLAGLPVPPEVHGVSLVPLLEGAQTELRDATYTHFYEDTGEHHAAAYVAIRTKTHKLIHYYDRGFTELFDLVKDPSEMRSVAEVASYQPLRQAMEKRLAELADQFGDKTAPWGDDVGGAVPEKSRVSPQSKAPQPAFPVTRSSPSEP
jgi:arylsulfatase A-like enzyme